MLDVSEGARTCPVAARKSDWAPSGSGDGQLITADFLKQIPDVGSRTHAPQQFTLLRGEILGSPLPAFAPCSAMIFQAPYDPKDRGELQNAVAEELPTSRKGIEQREPAS
jgi:hypothetical protein